MSRSASIVGAVSLWWACTVAPALLTLAGAFHEDVTVNLTGWVAVAWIGGFFAQYGALFLVAHVVGHARDWWLIVASLLPWAVDMGTPYGWALGLLLVAAAGGVAVLMAVTALRSVALDTDGRLVTARVVRVLRSRFNVVVNNIYVKRRVLLDIPAADGSAYQGVLSMLCELGATPDPGDKVRLRVDPDNPKHFALDQAWLRRDR